ncbi:MAG: hypothetical protein ACKPKO_42595 [Candidatus Fonsibacter sp.]
MYKFNESYGRNNSKMENDIEDILNNGSNKFLEFLEGESIRYDQGHEDIIKKSI